MRRLHRGLGDRGYRPELKWGGSLDRTDVVCRKPMGTWGRGRGGKRSLHTLPGRRPPLPISGQDKREELLPLIEVESTGGTRAFVLVGLVSEDGVDNKLVLGPLGLEVECSSGSWWDSELETRV